MHSTDSIASLQREKKADYGSFGRHRAIGIGVGNRVYAGTGHLNGTGVDTWYADWWEYDPATNAWTQKADYIDYGTINCDEIKIEPDACLAPVDPFPVVNNYAGGVINGKKMNVGAGCESGSLYNFLGGKINLSADMHNDGYICNQDTIKVAVKFDLHGGTIDCCGFMEVPLIKIHANSGRPGTTLCQNYCTAGGSTPNIEIGGTAFTPLTNQFTVNQFLQKDMLNLQLRSVEMDHFQLNWRFLKQR